MFKEAYVQKIALKHGFDPVIVKFNCLPEMRKDRVYEIIMRLHHRTGEIQFAKCGYVPDKCPTASCKYIGSIYYALEDFSRTFLADNDEFELI